jgi:hypothetical protein
MRLDLCFFINERLSLEGHPTTMRHHRQKKKKKKGKNGHTIGRPRLRLIRPKKTHKPTSLMLSFAVGGTFRVDKSEIL